MTKTHSMERETLSQEGLTFLKAMGAVSFVRLKGRVHH